MKLTTIEEQQGFIDAYLNGEIETKKAADILGSRTAHLHRLDEQHEKERTQRIIERTAFKIMQTGETDLIRYVLNEIETETKEAYLAYWDLRSSVAITYFPPPKYKGVMEYKQANSLEQLLEIIKALATMTGITAEIVSISKGKDFSLYLRNSKGKYIGAIATTL